MITIHLFRGFVHNATIYAYKKGYSQVTRSVNKFSANKNSIFNKKVNTVRVKDTTAKDRAVVNENKGKGANAVKASACWVWKAKNSSASNTFKKYSYIDARGVKSIMAWIPKEYNSSYFLCAGQPQRKEYKESSIIRRHLKLEDADGISSLPNTKIFEQLALMRYASDSDKLTFQKEGERICNDLKKKKLTYGVLTLKLNSEGQKVGAQDEGKLLSVTELVEDFGSGEKGEKEISTANISISTSSAISKVSTSHVSTTEAVISTVILEVSTDAENLVYIRRSAEKRKDKGKAIMKEDESIQKKIKKQLEQERLSHEAAIRLQEQVNEEERQRIARDAKIAKQLQEEIDTARQEQDKSYLKKVLELQKQLDETGEVVAKADPAQFIN
ncbi:hypothetical protein Tco_0627491 [Tanacetum coccineum]|uniref:Uncharacterized protein n=1 Tax=Tanacetum coccineum TaxID=301880 RepID=A0ABQ4WMK6_9ASTR